MQTHHSIGVDEHITPSLIDIAVRFFGLIALQQLSEIDLPRFEPPDIPERRSEHAIPPVHLTSDVDKNRPRKSRILDIAAGKKVILKGNHRNFHVQSVKFIFLITQLRDVRTAGESTKMPVKDQQEPDASVLLLSMKSAVTILNRKMIRRLTSQITHNVSLQSVFTNFMAAEFMQ